MASQASSAPKPAILCLHGGGTNAMIFGVQTIRLQRALPGFEFVFIDAPHEASPGPGVHPVFEGCGPYYRWIMDFGKHETPGRTVELLRKTLEKRRLVDSRGFVGVLGFSQGAKFAAGLLLEEQIRGGWGFKFGVMLNGVVPPLTSKLSDEERERKITIPTLVVVGLQDQWRDDSRKLFTDHCDREHSTLIEFDLGHRMPTIDAETEQIAQAVEKMYQKSLGDK